MLAFAIKMYIVAALMVFSAWRAAVSEKEGKVKFLPFAKKYIKTELLKVWNDLKKFREWIRSPFPEAESEEE